MKSPQHASAGSETGDSGFNSRHIEGPMRTQDSHRSSTTNDSLSDGFGQRFDNVISMSEIGGQDEVVDMPNDKVRIQTIMEERSTAQYSMMAIDQSTVIRIKEPRMAKERQYMEQSQQPFAAAQVATAPTGIPASTVSSPPLMAQCLFSPSAPQVEDYALDAAPISSNFERATLMTDKQDGSVPHDVRPRTRSIARVERLRIPSSLDISYSEEEHAGQDHTSYFVPKPFGALASQSVVATKKVTGTARCRILSTLSKNSNYSPAWIVRNTRSTSAMTSTSSSKKIQTTSTYTPHINSAPRNRSANEDREASSCVGPPQLIECSSDEGDM
jgi:hypothetical protein